jgi:rare lipoprotein A
MKRLLTMTALLLLTSVAALPGLGCATGKSRPATAASSDQAKPAGGKSGYREKGIASWYGGKFHGRTTASGERYDMNKLTAAHKKLPFGSRVRVTNLDNGRQVEVRITDRGPFVHGRIIDLSREAARRIDMIQVGTARVRIEVIG